ncbi:TIGR02996 domain-containing protein [Fimbriiglobus ruber]|uniref:TIGR02996 domain-containing protein n=1 Tax=Fimbriiglobus ruber TaxID=1908690 RepID=A0A225E964_9BACT|nr:TIGR02996 domain-containing protein [Fimbriiglobus ruber]OWK45135.1 hypothetical protein FRUB_01466 [Fimbriiglobus ruber]
MSSTREALEAALAARPNDVVRHSAYADLLMEEGDPRGDYIRLALACEDRDQPADRLRALEQEAFALRQRYEAEWLGPLAKFIDPPTGSSVGAMVASRNVEVTWKRGWLYNVDVNVLRADLAAALAACPVARALQRFTVMQTRPGPPAATPRSPAFIPLVRAPWLPALRHFAFGPIVSGQSVLHLTEIENFVAGARRLKRLEFRGSVEDWSRFWARSPRRLRRLEITTSDPIPFRILESCERLGNLRRIQLGSITHRQYPGPRTITPDELRTFFRSPHFPALRYLTLRLPQFGDVGIDELIASGLIDRLRGLDLTGCGITDDGAQELAVCPAVSRLKYLRVDDNQLSPVGIDALAGVGVTVTRSAFGWHVPDDAGLEE